MSRHRLVQNGRLHAAARLLFRIDGAHVEITGTGTVERRLFVIFRGCAGAVWRNGGDSVGHARKDFEEAGKLGIDAFRDVASVHQDLFFAVEPEARRIQHLV